jgi:FkbM family methyltransferase
MKNQISKFKLNNLLPYLFTRTKLRFFDKFDSKYPSKDVQILDQTVSLSMKDLEQKYLAADCVREPENLLVYRALAKTKLVNTFVDVGANCGHVAASILNYYDNILLFEPNPKLANLLRQLYASYSHVKVIECAIVDEASVGTLTLNVPDDSSGLATLGQTHLSAQHANSHTYSIRASTLELESVGFDLSKAYIKIDVEGFEENIIRSASKIINNLRPIVGFEALSIEAAEKCGSLFNNHIFYCSRFDFLENGGALSRSVFGMLKALVFGSNIELLKIQNLKDIKLVNFSQVYAVPVEKSTAFEKSVQDYSQFIGAVDVSKLHAWKKI